jgi:small conductance mechanosensitive channel
MSVPDLVVDLVVRYGFQAFGAIVVLVIGALGARWTGRFLDRRLERQAMDAPMRLLIVRVGKITVLLFALVVALDKFGFQIAPLVAGIGVAGVGVGLALQGVLGNLMAGLTIIFTKPFRVGEYIELLNVRGDVASIELSSTTLLHPDRSRVIIPNRKIVGEILHNFGHTRQLHLSVMVPHGSDLGLALGAAHDVLAANPRVLKDPAPAVGVSLVTESAIKIGVDPWVRVPDVGDAEAELYRALVERLRATGIAPPVARHEVRLLNGVPAVGTVVSR